MKSLWKFSVPVLPRIKLFNVTTKLLVSNQVPMVLNSKSIPVEMMVVSRISIVSSINCVNLNFKEMWMPGPYGAKLNVCEGECGSWVKRPHSRLLASVTAGFNITG